MVALALSLSACGSTLVAYDLTAATPAASKAPQMRLRIREPVAGPNLDSERILVRDGNSLAVLAGGAWGDRLPQLVQARLLQTFQNGHGLRAVGEDAGAYDADLRTELRAFELDAALRVVRIDIVAKLVSPGGQILAARIYRAEAPVDSTDPGVVAAALDHTLGGVLRDIAAFASR